MIAVAGCGIAGFEAAITLERYTDAAVTVIDPGNHLLFYPSLHSVLEGGDIDAARIALEERFSDTGIDLVQDSVTGMDPSENTIQTENKQLEYRKAVVSLGVKTSYGDIEQRNVHDLRFRDDTLAIAERVEENDLKDLVIVGGGTTGVEAAASLFHASGELDEFSITLIEAEDRLTPEFAPHVSRRIAQCFRKRGIGIRTGLQVNAIEESCVVLENGTEIPSDLTVWAGGTEMRPVIGDLGLPASERGVPVETSMRVEGCTDVYAAGDIVSYPGKEERAFHAIKEGRQAAKNLVRDLNGKSPAPLEIGWEPNLIHLGGGEALFELNGFTWQGRIPGLLRSIGVEKRYMWKRTKVRTF